MLANLEHFNATPLIKAVRRALYRVLKPAAGMRILDAGCGPGHDVAALAGKLAPDGFAVGLDISGRFLAGARQRYGDTPAAGFCLGSVASTGFKAGTFDAAFAMRTLQYVDNPAEGVAELARVTRPGGRVAVVEGGMAVADVDESQLSRRVFGPKPGFGAKLPDLMRAVGLTRVRVRPVFRFEHGKAPAKLLEYAESAAQAALAEGVVGQAEADRWLSDLRQRMENGRWFSADCVFVVSGTVPRRVQR
jgi:ubiquinone/menaquinone biosynthesis C-methylase UbiE